MLLELAKLLLFPLIHFMDLLVTLSEIVRDIIIGVLDGLTIPFALAIGLSGANASSFIVLTAGIGEVAAGATPWTLQGVREVTFLPNDPAVVDFLEDEKRAGASLLSQYVKVLQQRNKIKSRRCWTRYLNQINMM